MALKALAQENHNLREYLLGENTVGRDVTQSTDTSGDTLIGLLEKQDHTLETQLSELQETLLHQIDERTRAQAQLEKVTLESGPVARRLKDSLLAQKKVEKLEDRKHHVLSSKGLYQSEANRLRQEIDGLRRERKLFDMLFQKKQKECYELADHVFKLLRDISKILEMQSKTKSMILNIEKQYKVEEREHALRCEQLSQELKDMRDRDLEEQERRAQHRSQKVHGIMSRVNDPNCRYGRQKRRDGKSLMDTLEIAVESVRDQISRLDANMLVVVEQINERSCEENCPASHDVIKKFHIERTACMSLLNILHEKKGKPPAVQGSGVPLSNGEKYSATAVHLEQQCITNGTRVQENHLLSRLMEICDTVRNVWDGLRVDPYWAKRPTKDPIRVLMNSPGPTHETILQHLGGLELWVAVVSRLLLKKQQEKMHILYPAENNTTPHSSLNDNTLDLTSSHRSPLSSHIPLNSSSYSPKCTQVPSPAAQRSRHSSLNHGFSAQGAPSIPI